MHSFSTGFSLRELTNFHYNIESAFGLECYLYLACVIMLENFFNLYNYINCQVFTSDILIFSVLGIIIYYFDYSPFTKFLATVDITSVIY